MKRVILGCVLLCVLVPAAARAAVKARFATDTHASVRVGYNEGADRLLAVPGAVRHSNTQVARVPISWPQIEEDDDDFDWQMLDRVVALLRGAHIRPMISVYGSPDWAGADTPGIHCPCDRAADPEWREMWQQVALRYQDALLNVWNEPNYAAYGSVKVARMAELTNKAAAAIWQVDPGRKVIGPAASPGVHGWLSYMRALYRRLDGRIELAANIYPYGKIIRNFRRDANAIRRLAGRRDYWITETNVSRAQVGAERQSRFVRVAYAYAQRKRLSGLIFHRLWSPFSKHAGIFSWDAGLSALARNGAPTRLYRRVGTLHPGFHPPAFRPNQPGGDIIVGTPQPPTVSGPPKSPTPCTG